MDEDQRNATRLEVILLLISRIDARLAKTTREHFLADHDDIDLLAYRLAMIGEEANKLSSGFKDRFTNMPWKTMYGLRNIVSHGYMMVSPERLWEAASSSLDALARLCREEIARIDK